MYRKPRPTSEDRFFFHKERYHEYCGSPLEILRWFLKGLEDLIGGVFTVIMAVLGFVTTSLMWVATRFPWIIPAVSCVVGVIILGRRLLS